MKLQLVANKLDNCDVTHISLVDRGANRIPFRIIKQSTENGMLDLGKIGLNMRAAKKAADEAVTSSILAFVVEKSAKLEEIKAKIVAGGFVVDKAQEMEDGTVVFSQIDEDLSKVKDAIVVRMSDSLLAVVKGFSPYQVGPEGGSFTELVKAQSFIPGLSMASQALADAISSVLYTIDPLTQQDAVSKIDGVLTEFHNYVVGMAKGIPAKAFKVDRDIRAIMKADEMDKNMGEDGNCKPGYELMDGKCVVMKDDKKKAADEAAAKKVADDAAAAEAAKKAEEEAAAKKKASESEADPMKQILEQARGVMNEALQGFVTQVTGQITGLVEKVDGVVKSQGELATKVQEATDTALKAEAAAKGKLIGGAPADDRQQQRVEKGDNFSSGAIDTALHDVRKNSRFATKQSEAFRRRQGFAS
jgi:hypothetical protein